MSKHRSPLRFLHRSVTRIQTGWKYLLPRLEGAGVRVCIDRRDFEIGTPSLVNMERAVDSSRHTLLVLTPAWVESEWTDFESLLGGTGDPAGRRRKFFPIMLKECMPSSRISMLTWADFTQPDKHVDQFERLLEQLRDSVEPAHPPADDTSPFIAGPPIMHPRGFFGRKRKSSASLASLDSHRSRTRRSSVPDAAVRHRSCSTSRTSRSHHRRSCAQTNATTGCRSPNAIAGPLLTSRIRGSAAGKGCCASTDQPRPGRPRPMQP